MNNESFFLNCGFEEKDVGLYSSLFQKHCIEENQLSLLTHELLKEMGIDIIGHRIKYVSF